MHATAWLKGWTTTDPESMEGVGPVEIKEVVDLVEVEEEDTEELSPMETKEGGQDKFRLQSIHFHYSGQSCAGDVQSISQTCQMVVSCLRRCKGGEDSLSPRA